MKLDPFFEIKKPAGAAHTGALPFLERPSAPKPPAKTQPEARPKDAPKATGKNSR